MYDTLDPQRIIATIEVLERRIGERFPNSGLARVCAELAAMARETSANVAAIARPNILLRILVGLILGVGIACLLWLVILGADMEASTELTNVMQGLDSATSLLIVFGGVALFLWTLEGRWRRDRALKELHGFRSIVHVIDMHQLTKDPSAFGAARTSSSPDRSMSVPQLLRYLGYCSELLSLSAKVAALYGDKVRDPVVIDAVGDIERLTSNLSQKIWQKIELFQQRMPQRPASDELGPKRDH
jgi:hypothetical protein